MVGTINIGVLGIQGAVSEHEMMMKQVMISQNGNPKITIVRRTQDLDHIQGLIIPGGESTTISRFLLRKNLHQIIKDRVADSTLCVMGTCAGCVLLAQEIDDPTADISLLCLMDMKVKRNAFGRQKESFERCLRIDQMTKPFPAVFIRAPLILDSWNDCVPLATIKEGVVMTQQKNCLALSFHPELTSDLRVHTLFYTLVKKFV